MSSNFAHNAAFNATKAAYATADAVTSAASATKGAALSATKSTKTFGTSLLIGVKAGFAAAKRARATPNLTAKLVK